MKYVVYDTLHQTYWTGTTIRMGIQLVNWRDGKAFAKRTTKQKALQVARLRPTYEVQKDS